MTVKKKTILTILLLINIVTMFLSWFGGARGVQEIKGTIVLFNPITLFCIVLFIVGIWYPFKKANNWICLLSMLGIISVEIYEFVFWHYMTITGEVDLLFSFNNTYSEFYVGLMISLSIFIYCVIVIFYGINVMLRENK